jgi:hypothetical protein
LSDKQGANLQAAQEKAQDFPNFKLYPNERHKVRSEIGTWFFLVDDRDVGYMRKKYPRKHF